MAEARWPIGGIVLCGGGSRRMGRPKAWLPFGEESLLERMVRLLGEVAEPVVVAAKTGQALPPLPPDVRVVFDAPGQEGPLAGVAAGLAALGDLCEIVLVVSCDVPLVRPAFLVRLAELIGENEAVAPECDGRPQPAVAAYRPRLVKLANELLAAGERRMNVFAQRCGALVVPADRFRDVDPKLLSLKNVNTPEEYEEAVRLVQATRAQPDFRSFTANARKAFALANQVAQHTWHEFLLPGHLMHGLLRFETCRGYAVLRRLQVDLAGLRKKLLAELEATGSSTDYQYRPHHSSGTGAKRAVEAACDEAKRLGHAFVGTEHLLLGLVAIDDERLGPLLRAAQVPDLAALRDRVVQLGPRPPGDEEAA